MARLFPENRFVPPRWGSGLRLAVAEAPGETEAAQGEPLVGGSGTWLRGRLEGSKRRGGMYHAAGVRDEEVTYCNVVQCRPPKNAFPTSSEARSYISREEGDAAVAQCLRAHVEPVLRARAWTRIDLFGDKPLRYIAGDRRPISEVRGTPMPVPVLGEAPLAIPTFHPAYIARDQSMLPIVVNDLAKSLRRPPENYNLYPSVADVRAFTARTFAFDIETNMRTGEITMVGLCADVGTALVVPFSGDYKAELVRIFRNAERVIGWNSATFDLPMLAKHGVTTPAECWDAMLVHHLLFPDFPHDLGFAGRQFTTIGAWKGDKENFELYNARDTATTWAIYLQLAPRLKREGLEQVAWNVSLPLARICQKIQEHGVRVDPDNFDRVRTKTLEQMAVLETELPEPLRGYDKPKRKRVPAPPEFVGKSGKPVKYVFVPTTERVQPWRSSEAKAKYLYDVLGLPVQYSPKAQDRVTTDKAALDKLVRRYGEKFPWLGNLKKLNALATLLSGFVKAERKSAGWIHPRFSVWGTSTGRLSSSGPNFQNQSPAAKLMYVPSTPEKVLIEADVSNLENRLTAWFSRDDERLARLAQPGFNEHRWVASQLYDTPYEEIEKDNSVDAIYGRTKRINLGTNYGLGARKISLMYDIPEAEVKRIMGGIKTRAFPRLATWQAETYARAKRDGYLTNPFGRKLWFWTSDTYTRSLAFLPQSTGADLLHRVMIGLYYERIGWPLERALAVCPAAEPLPPGTELLAQVHDALLLEVPRPDVDRVVEIVRRVMCQPWPELGGYAFPISVTLGESWGEMEEYKCLRTEARAA